MQDKFMHRETTISREIKLLKNKFELLEKNRQFRSILQSKPNTKSGDSGSVNDATSGLDATSVVDATGTRSTRNSVNNLDSNASSAAGDPQDLPANKNDSRGLMRRFVSVFSSVFRFFTSIFRKRGSVIRHKSNRVSNLATTDTINEVHEHKETAAPDPIKLDIEPDGSQTKETD